MKKLLLILFSLILSFESFGGSIDGKGLKCEHYHGPYEKPIYMWFNDGFFEIPIIEGTTIKWKRYTYTEWGTKYILFNKEWSFLPSGYPFY